MNHTSDQHPWFQACRSDPDGPYGDFYVWSDDDTPLPRRADHLRRHRAVELDVRPGAQAVLLAPLLQPPARPELRLPRRAGGDHRRAAVLARPRHRRLPPRRRALPLRPRRHERREPARDARVPQAGAQGGRRATTPTACCSCEANQWPADVVEYFGDPAVGGDECHMAFHFPVMPRIFMAVRRESRYPISEIMAQTPADPGQLPVGHLPAQPRRADARDGHRRRARLHVGRVRQATRG